MRRTLSVTALAAMVVVAAACGSSTTATTPADTALGFATTPGSDPGTTVGARAGTGTTQKAGTTTSTSGDTTSSSSASSTSTTSGGGGGGTVSQADFDAKINDLCSTFQSEGDKIFAGDNPTQADFDKAIAFLKDFLDKVKAAGIPAGKEQAAQAFYASWDKFISVFQQYGPDLVGGKEPPSSALADLESVTNDVEKTAKALGNFDTCFASSSSSSGGTK